MFRYVQLEGLRKICDVCLLKDMLPRKNDYYHYMKFYCVYSSNGSKENKGTTKSADDIREIPLQVKFDINFGTPSMTSSERTTVCEAEVEKFRKLAQSWWDVDGEFKPLHSLNKLRVSLIRKGLIDSKISHPDFALGAQPLKGLKLLDVGCGGGILCEPLARLGAQVTGLDASEENIVAARLHAEKDKVVSKNVSYIHGAVERHAMDLSEPYDAVIASEVLEHVESPELFVNTCASVVKPGGSLFFTTINRTMKSWLAAIVAAEYLLGLLPRGTHDWNKFVPYEDLRLLLGKNGCSIKLIHGMFYLPIRNEWFWVSDSSVNYALHAVKE